ncbi:glycosyltransferase family 4 protein [Rickettsiella endosymbiont of Rhagonycha lignosa]|uniref:glycosyltransferase family 4 protein n=1 Tax=Rickettsiella endosymbiont of Rhagonycha lignosa TaxID=3077937 RepID=UPI00313CE650
MKVAIKHTHFRFKGGMETYLKDIILGFSKAGDELTLCVCKINQDILKSLPPLTVLKFPYKFLPRSLKKFAFYLGCDRENLICNHNLVISLVKTTRQDILICGGVHKAYLLTKKSYRFIHNYLETYFEKRAFERTPLIIAHSQRIKDEIIQHYPSAASKIKVLYPPVSNSHFYYKTTLQKHDLRKKLGFSDKTTIVLFVSTNHARKGLYPLVNAFRCLKDDFLCLILGEKPTISLPDNMRWLGFIKQIQDYYCIADVTILASTYEPFGITIVESLESGTPVIVSSDVGAAELLEANDGIILTTVTPETIIDALEKVKSKEYRPERDFLLRKGLTIDCHIQALKQFARISVLP